MIATLSKLKLFADSIIQNYGYPGIFTLTTAEQFIFPVPADVFIPMAISAKLDFNTIIITILFGALVGSYVGYFLGKYLGHPFMEWLFGKKKIDSGERFIKKYGVWGVIVAGLTPIPFKIVTWTAGIFEMPLKKYTIGVIIGRMPRYLISAYLANWFFRTEFYKTAEMKAVILGTIQGITEFLPISSSGHLVLTKELLGLPIDITLFNIFLHGGSLLAIILYFWKDWILVIKSTYKFIFKKDWSQNNLAFKLAVSTIPAIIAGLMFGDYFDQFENKVFVAIAFILLGIFFFIIERRKKKPHFESVGFKKAIIMGMSQALALLPGISRSGVTISTGMLYGIKREVAAKFSFLLGGIAILAANSYALIKLSTENITLPETSFILYGVITSFVVSLVSVHLLMIFLKKHSLRIFSFYLILAGAGILSFMYYGYI